MSTTLQQWANAQANPEVTVNENFTALSHVGCYAMRPAATTGLVWAWYGGRWGGQVVADGSATLTASTTSYVTVNRSTGAVAVATTTTAWDDTTNHARAYKLTTGTATVTAVEDHRAGPGGAHGQPLRISGSVVLVAGAATVATTAVKAGSLIQLTSQAGGGTPGWLRVSARTAGASFTITSSSASDTSTVAWEMQP